MFIFKHQDMLYTNPDAYILSQEVVNWGERLKVYPVYRKGFPALSGYQDIQVMFFHEGNTGSVDDTYWVTSGTVKEWYEPLSVKPEITEFDLYKVVHFHLFGENHPQYFYTKEDLCWYLTHIYPLQEIFVNDEYPSDIE